jgi:hypothetical protein
MNFLFVVPVYEPGTLIIWKDEVNSGHLLNYAPRDKIWPKGWSWPPGVNFVP